MDKKDEWWYDSGLSKARHIAVGQRDEAYALGEPKKNIVNDSTFDYTIYKWEGKQKWTALPGPGAVRIAVGENGKVFIRDQKDRILVTDALRIGELKEQHRLCLIAQSFAIQTAAVLATGLTALSLF